MENREILYEYQDNRFVLEQQNGWYSKWTNYYMVKKIIVMNGRLCLPDSYRGNPVKRWYMHGGAPYPMVKELFIPGSITEISIDNALFPNLEKVEVEAGHSDFGTDGKMLFSADGRELLYGLAAGNLERAVVPGEVRRILRNAFSGTVCREIIFENADISAERDAFEDSEWIKCQGEYCVVGNLFFRLNRSVEHLRVPDGIRRFHESAFWKAVPRYLDTPLMPSRSNMEDLGGRRGYRQCEELTLRSAGAGIDMEMLRGWYGLRAVHFAKEHKRYCSADGIIFSKDRKSLEFYPQGKREKSYHIPEGVVKIGRQAFRGQNYLEEISMPDSVTTVGMGAFYQCGSLKKVDFSGNIREIPDASAYQNGGVFEQCKALKEVVLPRKLQYLGSRAFYASGLREIRLNEGLRQIGEYALAAEELRKVSLPQSVERLGKGALLYVYMVEAYAGTARGLVPAVNAVLPNFTDKCANLEWDRCMVFARHKRGNKTEKFLIPGSLKRNAAYHLDMAWNGDQIDYGEYDACFEAIQDSQERMEFAEMGILRTNGEESPYTAYMRHSALKIAMHLVEESQEKEFLAFLQRGYLSESALSRLLKMTNQKQLTTCSAYILKYQNARGSRKKKKFTL